MASAESILLRLRLQGQRETQQGLASTAREVRGVGSASNTAAGHLGRMRRQSDESVRSYSRLRVGARGASGSIGLVAGGAARMAAAAGGFLAVGAGIRVAFSEATEAAKVGAQTAAVLKSTGGAAKVTAGHVGDLANSISAYAGIDDEAIQSAENLMLTFTAVRNEAGKGNKVFDQATVAATNMGVALGTDTRSAALMLGKALNDPAKGYSRLMRSGVSFSEQQIKQIKTMQASGNVLGAQKLILREVNREFGGSAAAQATPWEKLNVTLHNVAETLGLVLLPYVNKAATWLNTFIRQMQNGQGAGGRFVQILKSTATAIGAVVKAGVAVGQTVVPVIRTLVEKYGPGVVAFGRGLYNAFSQAMGPIRPVITALLLVGKRIIQIAGFMFTMMRPALRAMGQGFRGMAQIIGGAIHVITSLIHGDFGGAIDGMKSMVTGAKNVIVGAFRSMAGVAKSVFGTIGRVAAGALKAPINAVIGAWNAMHISIPKIKLPGPVPDIPGFTVGLPQIPKLATGGTIKRGGVAVVGDRGPELLNLPTGGQVIGNRQIARGLDQIAGGGGLGSLIHEIRQLTSALREHDTVLRLDGKTVARASTLHDWRQDVLAT